MSNEHRHVDREWREPNTAPGPASLLDIGGEVGAIVVRLTADTPTGELMACRRGDPSAHFHTGVHLRPAEGTECWIAVFPEVDEGDYSLLTDEGTEHTPFVVRGGEVTTIEPEAGETTRRR